jgi:hypothetical protein
MVFVIAKYGTMGAYSDFVSSTDDIQGFFMGLACLILTTKLF